MARALSDFDEIWKVLVAPQRQRVLQLLIERLSYDAEAGKLDIHYSPAGFAVMAAELDGGGHVMRSTVVSYQVDFSKRAGGGQDRGSASTGRTPRVAVLLALAHRIDRMIRDGDFRDLADAARAINTLPTESRFGWPPGRHISYSRT